MEKPKGKRRFNWGTGIAFLYIGFVLGILTLVTLSMNQRVDLVAEDYYAQELDFQNKIDKSHRASQLAHPLRWRITDQALEVNFPADFNYRQVSGKIRFYCPSDNSRDTEFAIKPSATNHQRIALKDVLPGRYLLQFDWRNGQTTYWNEGAIVVEPRQPQAEAWGD